MQDNMCFRLAYQKITSPTGLSLCLKSHHMHSTELQGLQKTRMLSLSINTLLYQGGFVYVISCTAHPHELPEGTVLSYHYHQQKRAQGLAPVGDQQILERKHPEQTPNILLKILGTLSHQE